MASTINDGTTTLTFAFWNDPPGQISQQVQSFSRAGAVGLSHRKLGVRGRTFSSQLVSHHSSYSSARSSYDSMLGFVGKVVNISHEGEAMSTTHDNSYVVEQVDLVECQTVVRLVGPGYNYAGGARMTTVWTMSPIDKDLA
jgi:hypothetical protein